MSLWKRDWPGIPGQRPGIEGMPGMWEEQQGAWCEGSEVKRMRERTG